MQNYCLGLGGGGGGGEGFLEVTIVKILFCFLKKVVILLLVFPLSTECRLHASPRFFGQLPSV